MEPWIKTLVAGCAFAVMAGAAMRRPLRPSTRIRKPTASTGPSFRQSSARSRRHPRVRQIGGVSKTLTNEYWRSLGEGYQAYAKKAGVEVVYQAAPSEGDQLGQLSIAENLISQGFNALLFSPQTDFNLQPALERPRPRGSRSSTSMTR